MEILPNSAKPIAAGPRQNSMLIERSSNLPYENLEGARTKHACEPCRERKTKCDGERPTCRRCLSRGSTCLYGYEQGWKRRKTQKDLSSTLIKLGKYEALLSVILPLVGPAVQAMIEDTYDRSGSPDFEESSQPDHLDRITLPNPLPFAIQNARFSRLGSLSDPLSPKHGLQGGVRHLRSVSSPEMAFDRLPSITAIGKLIDQGESSSIGNRQYPFEPTLPARRESFSFANAIQL